MNAAGFLAKLALWAGRLVVVALGGIALMWVSGWLLLPDISGQTTAHYTPEEIKAAEEARDPTFDPNNPPVLHRDMVVKPRGESPILAELVKEGKLPPVEERMPDKPTVMEGPDGIGNYGGTWLRVGTSNEDLRIFMIYRMAGQSLMRWSPLGYPIQPQIAKSVEPNEDMSEWTVTLREGMKWSDGHPYTANDIIYWWEHEANNDLVLAAPPPFMMVSGKPGRVEKVNDYQVKFIFDEPVPLFRERLLATEATGVPEHYLRQYNPDPAVGNKELIEREMKAYKQSTPRALYQFLKEFWNPLHPRLWPWVYRTYQPGNTQVFVRNPYFYVVDPQGNQLPYVDRVHFTIAAPNILLPKFADGDVTMQTRHVKFTDYTELMTRRSIGGTSILHWYPSTRSIYVINPNLNRFVDPEEPATKWKAQLLFDKRFRQAMSLAINRGRIIRAEYYGIGEPSQVSPGPESLFYNEKQAKGFAEYDPESANRLLDELGLDERDYEGMRTFPDGTRMTFFLDFTDFTGIGPGQFIVDDWREVGVRVIARERSRQLFYLEKDSMTFDFNIWTGESDNLPLLSPRYFIPLNLESFYAYGWGKWYSRGGYYGSEFARNSPGAIPVPQDHPMYEAITAFEKATRAQTFEEQKALVNRMMEIAAENLWTISIGTPPPQLVVVKQGFKNVPPLAFYGSVVGTPSNAGVETYFFEKPSDSPGAIAETKRAIEHITPRPGGESLVEVEAKTVGRWDWVLPGVRGFVWGVAGMGFLLILITYSYVRQRVMIMVPTLFVMSIVVFTLIQLPPGDYMTTRIIQLSESGEPAELMQIEEMKKTFHFDKPMIWRYAHWMGFRWFATFDEDDTGLFDVPTPWGKLKVGTFESDDMGLLQLDFGRSMQTSQPVTELLGDAMRLTVVISIGTILFTWIVALPIGIYSAVRQYSISDYLLTLLGMLGMSVPAFLLALVLMATADVRGLFSPEFSVQPEWDWPKLVDMLKHVWIPIVVLGVSGTAVLIRVMRANLLDELRKPYVVTARSKGVRPVKLLLKYPVRMALNPFISGIGAIFPAIVSSGAIVGIVLSLPIVGPLMLQALLAEDMFLAGSLLMLLSVLSVIGTLVSDLLLLWLDPRIRFEGGTR